MGNMCEDCGIKRANCGVLEGERKVRWCGSCAERHKGGVIRKDMCEDCGLKRATRGMPDGTKTARWCGLCSQQHEGARLQHSACEDCGLKQATWGMPDGTKKKRWCSPCSHQHAGSRRVGRGTIASVESTEATAARLLALRGGSHWSTAWQESLEGKKTAVVAVAGSGLGPG
jgi:hypothetical protein